MAEARLNASQVEPDFAARQAVVSAIGWLVIAATAGLIVHLLTLVPALGFNEFLSYGRWRAVADNATVFGWLTTAGFAAAFAIVPRLAVAQLHNEVLGAAAIQGWNLLLFGGIGALLLGLNQGRALAEFPAGVDIGVAFVLVIVLYNVVMTIVRRRERTLYVSAWYLVAAVVVLPIVWVVGNVPVFTGLTDAIAGAWYRNGLEMLWLLPVGLAVAQYVTPVESGTALYSKTLARAGFWSLLFAAGWTGGRYLLKTAVPDYFEVMAVAMTMVLAVPVLSAVVNVVGTTRGRSALAADSFGLRFALLGVGFLAAWYALVLAGAIPSISRLVGFTPWVSGVDLVGRWGAFSALAFAFLYHVYPLLVGRDWYSRGLAAFHFWGTLAGVGAGAFALCASGLVQGALFGASSTLDGGGELADLVQASVGLQRGFQIAAAVAFAVVAAAQYAFAYNAFRTSRSGPYLLEAAPAMARTRA